MEFGFGLFIATMVMYLFIVRPLEKNLKRATLTTAEQIEQILKDSTISFEFLNLNLSLYIKHSKMSFSVSGGHIAYAKLRDGMTRKGYLKAPAPPVAASTSNCWHVLAILPTKDRDKVESAYKKMALVYHPDRGGNSAAFQTLTKAKDRALELCGK